MTQYNNDQIESSVETPNPSVTLVREQIVTTPWPQGADTVTLVIGRYPAKHVGQVAGARVDVVLQNINSAFSRAHGMVTINRKAGTIEATPITTLTGSGISFTLGDPAKITLSAILINKNIEEIIEIEYSESQIALNLKQ